MVDRKPRPRPLITFVDKNFKALDPDHDDPMAITIEIARYKVNEVLLDQGSSINTLYRKTFQKMDFSKDLIVTYNE